MPLYKGYVETKGKASIEKLKNRTTWKTYDDVKNLNGFGGVLADDTILIDIDDSDQSEILMNIVEELQLDCKVLCTSRGKHFLFKNHTIARNRTHVQLAVGLTADIKVGSKLSYEVIKIDGEERFCEWDIEEGGKYQEVPKWLFPVKATADFVDMDAGDGRNQALFNYILTLTANDFTVEETRECIRILNKFVLKQPLSDDELEVILRDDAFQKPVFFLGSTFLFDKFAVFMKNTAHVIKINGQLHIYKDGVYSNGYKEIESNMIQHIPNLKKMQRREVLDYMELIVDEKEQSDANLIAFNNGVYDLVTGELKPFSTDIVITNKIPWDYKPDAYSELADSTLNKLACGDAAIRALLEECIGYCFYRRNELGKAFILTGDKSNGKSTFLDCVKAILGDRNISALDLKELGDRFNTSMMFGKLANIGDDIGDDFLQGSQVSVFKKIVTGILERMMNRVSDKIDKRPSSPVYDLHSSTAIEFQILYIELEYLIKNSYGDTAAREFLILLAKDRGLSPEPATKAILQGEFTPTNIDVTGKRFNIGKINYVVTEQITPGTYKVQCETEGVVGNQYLGDMIPMEYIDGLQTASLTSVLIPGEDEEDTEVFRQRYFDSFNEQSFGGNHADYMAKVKSIEGVGACKVKRVWNGDIRPADMIVSTVVKNWYESIISTVPAAVKPWLDAVYNAAKDKKLTVGGTVHVVITDSDDYGEASSTLVQYVQQTLDPEETAGEGYGLAPIGHVVSVASASPVSIEVKTTVTFEEGHNWSNTKAAIAEVVDAYFLELRKNWSETSQTIVRVSQIENRILGVDGVVDVTGTKLNGTASNMTLTEFCIPKLGGVSA